MIEILDTTLRDGEQTSDVSFVSSEKLSIASLLIDELKVDRVEIASAHVSNGEYESVRRIAEWAKSHGHLHRLEVLGFVDGDNSLKWVKKAGCEVMNLLCKGSLKHCKEQLHKTPEEHVRDIKKVLQFAEQMDIEVNIYLEDWSNGMISSSDYVFFVVNQLKSEKIKHFMLPDTLGVLNPKNTAEYCAQMLKRYPSLLFDFHSHNDYDLAVANVFAAASVGIKGFHTTVNGLGERAGNAPLTSVVAMLHDQLNLKTNIVEEKLYMMSRIVSSYSGIRIPNNKPVTGDNVFTQCAGIHADGDNKNNLYYNDLIPERFGRMREYALGKMSGKASIKKNLEALGVELDDLSMKMVTERIIELGDKKEIVTSEDLPYIISDVLHNGTNDRIKMINYSLSLTHGLRPTATVKIEIDGAEYEQTASGEGQYNAFSKALWKIYTRLNKPKPILRDYNVSIPSGGRTDALVQTVISWSFNEKNFKTRGLDVDQTGAAIKATVKMLNMIENM